MDALSKRIRQMAPSATVAMNQRGTELKAQGIDIINLSVGEPDFPTPDYIKEAGHEAIRQNFTYYSPVPGYPELKKAIVQKMQEDNGLTYSPAQVMASNGAKHCVANALLALVDPGDEVIVPAPYWVSYIELVKLAEGSPVVIDATFENNFKITPEQLEAAITSRTKAIIICSPSNPTGAVYSRKELEALAGVLKKHPGIFIISDEIYEYINFVGQHSSLAHFDFLKERVVLINGVSKGFAMTGWRLGFMCAEAWLIKACTTLQGQMTTGPSSISQMAAIEALTKPKDEALQMKEAFIRRRDLVIKLLGDIKGIRCNIPEGAFYVFPDVSAFFGKSHQGRTINNATDMAFYLLDEARVALVMGEAFGAPDCIRISYATSDDILVKAIGAIKAALEKLN